MQTPRILWPTAIAMAALIAGCAAPSHGPRNASDPLLIQAQGSFAVGGTVQQTAGTYNNNQPTAEGQSLHGDHLYAFYQVPQNPEPCPS